MITYNKFIQELPTIATNRITLDTSLPIALEIDELNKLYETFQVSLKQLQILLKEPIDPEELQAIFVNDVTLSNISVSLINNLIALNYDETKLNTLIDLVDSIEFSTNKLITSLTNQDTNELYIVYDELRRIQNQFNAINELLSQIFINLEEFNQNFQIVGQEIYNINQEITSINQEITSIQEEIASFEGGGTYATEILAFPEIKDKNTSYYNPNNFFPWQGQYNVFLDKFSNKIIIHIMNVTQADGLFESNINIYNVKSIFDELTSNQRESAVLEFQLIFFSADEAKIPVKYFLSKKKIKFYAGNNNTNLLFEPNVGTNIYFAENKIRTYGFSLFFNKIGFIKHNSLDLSEFLARNEYVSALQLTQILATESGNYEISKLSNNSLFINYQDEPPHSLNVFSLIEEDLAGIDTIFINLQSYQNIADILSDIIFRFKFPFYRVKFDEVTFVFLENFVEKARIVIPNNLKSTQIVLIFDIESEELRYLFTDEEYYRESIIDFEIDYTKFNDQNSLTLAVTEQAQTITLNINLKQPFIAATGLMPNYVGTSVLPQDSEDTIAFVIDSKVGNLDLTQQIILNLNLGDTEGFFRNVAFFFSPNAVPTQFDYGASNTLLQIVPLGSNNQKTGITNDVSFVSTYVLQFIRKNNKTTLELVSDVCGDVTAFEEMRKNQIQKILQGVSTKLFDTTLYFPLAIASNRSALNFNLGRPNSEYTGSNVSLRVPPRTTEWVWNGYYKIDILNDKYQNLQALSRNYFVSQDFHFVDYYVVDSVFFPRISNNPTYPFDDKQSKTILIMVNGLTPNPRDFYFSLNLTFGLRFPEASTFFIRVVNRDYPTKLVDARPSLQILPDSSYGVQYFSSDNNFVYEKSFIVNRINLNIPFDVQTRKFNFALRLSSNLNQCQEIPYEPSLFITQNDLSDYPTLAEVQALIADIVSGGTIDLSEYATLTDLTNTQAIIENYVNDNFATKNALTQLNNTIQSQITNAQINILALQDTTEETNNDILYILGEADSIRPVPQNPRTITYGTDVICKTQSAGNTYIHQILPVQIINVSGTARKQTIAMEFIAGVFVNENGKKYFNNDALIAEFFIEVDGDIPEFTIQIQRSSGALSNPTIDILKTKIALGVKGARKYIIKCIYIDDAISDNTKYFIDISATDFALEGNYATQTDIQELRNSIEENQTDIAILSNGINSLNNNVTIIEGNVTANAGNIFMLNDEINLLRDDVTTNTTAITTIQSNISDLQDNIEKNQTDIQELQDNLEGNYYTAPLIDERFTDILEYIDGGTYLKAEHIINLVDKQYNTTAILDYGSSQDTIAVKSNTKNIYFNSVFADWDLESTPLETAMGYLSNNASTTLIPTTVTTAPEYVFTIREKEDLELIGCTFASVRYNDFFISSTTAGTGVITAAPTEYRQTFSVIFDISQLESDDLVRISLQGLVLRLGILQVRVQNYPGFTGTPVPSFVLRNYQCLFFIKIRKNGTTQTIASLPAYNYLQNTIANNIKAINIRLDAFEFFVNSAGFRVGQYYEGNIFGNYANANYMVMPSRPILNDTATAYPSQTIDADWNNQTICIPLISMKSSTYNPNNPPSVTTIVLITTNLDSDIENAINCKIQFYISGLTTNQVVNVYQNSISAPNLRAVLRPEFSAKPTLIELNNCVITQTTLRYTSYYKIVNQTFYDWNSNLYGLSLFNKTTTALTTGANSETNAITSVPQAQRDFIIPDGVSECIVDNIKLYHIRSILIALSSTNSNSTFAQSLRNCPVVFSTLSTEPVLFTIKSITLFRGCPFISTAVFPNNTAPLTTGKSVQISSDYLYCRIDDVTIGFFDAYAGTLITATSSAKLTLYPFFKANKIYIEKKDATLYAGLFTRASFSLKDKKVLYLSADNTIINLSLASQFNIFASLMENSLFYIKPFDSLTLTSDRTLYLPVGTEYQNSLNEFSFSTYIDFSSIGRILYLRVKPSNAAYYTPYYEINSRFYNQQILSLLFVKNPTSNASIPAEIRDYLFTDGYAYASDIAEGKKVYFFASPDVSITTLSNSSVLFDIFDNSVIYLMSSGSSINFDLRAPSPSTTINYSIRNLRYSSSTLGLKILNGITIASGSLAPYDVLKRTNRTITT